ncbi:hypothetical protein [Corallococcus silvisoli]|uniref:hypothetical protein n=1 Tax=Corallococcus silvisoli TaxID=2697031 RepID=UPI001376F896|nr:hypothetical protein [Corallococcus silvisoli]NBD11814.1 hypothetical protein [Corallococcus silvisoli]
MALCKDERTLTCHCGRVFRTRHSRARWCSVACTHAAKRLGLSKPYDLDDPGVRYDVPLDGLDIHAREARREERIARLISDGVPLLALCERFDCGESFVRGIAQRQGLPIVPGYTGAPPVMGV